MGMGLVVLAPWVVSAQEEETFLLLFPFFFEDEASFSGYGLLNHSPDSVQITTEGFDDAGQLIDFPENSAQGSLDSQNQVALLGSELFGDEPTRELQGWIRMSSATSDLSGFFQLGNGLEGRQTQLDGAVAFTEQSKVLFFTRVHEGPATFPNFGLFGPKDATTFLSIVNPNDERADITIRVLDSAGNLVGEASPPAGLGRPAPVPRTLRGDPPPPRLSLGPGDRLDRLVEDPIPESVDQIGGFIQIESTHSLAGQEVYGNDALDYTSALPPTVVEPTVDPVDPSLGNSPRVQ